jgi:chromosome partitioning protein
MFTKILERSMNQTNIISVINQKGGVLKTTSVLHIGAALAQMGQRVLLIDLDLTQANLTIATVGEVPQGDKGIINALFGDATLSEVRIAYRENLDVIPSEIKYQGLSIPLDVALSSTMGKESVLKKLLAPIKNDYDFILIDNGPTLGIATINSLVASNYFLIPTLADYLSLVGVQKTMQTIDSVREGLDHVINNLGLVLTMVDGREKIAKDSSEILNSAFEGNVYKSTIQRNVKFKSLAQKRETIFDLKLLNDKGAENYNNLANEIIEKLNIQTQTSSLIATKGNLKMKQNIIENNGAL